MIQLTKENFQICQDIYNSYLIEMETLNNNAYNFLVENYPEWDEETKERIRESWRTGLSVWMDVDRYIFDFLMKHKEFDIYEYSDDSESGCCDISDEDTETVTILWYWYDFEEYLAKNI